MQTNVVESFCPFCDRQHTQDQPCPMRIASYFFNKTQPLSVPDKQWLGEHKDFNPELAVEEMLADMM